MKKQYSIEGMHCASCALNIENQSKKLEGVVSSHVNYANSTLSIENNDVFSEQILFKKISQLGYKISSQKKDQQQEEDLYIKKLKIKLIYLII